MFVAPVIPVETYGWVNLGAELPRRGGSVPRQFVSLLRHAPGLLPFRERQRTLGREFFLAARRVRNSAGVRFPAAQTHSKGFETARRMAAAEPIAARCTIEKRICNAVDRRLTLQGLSDQASAGRATPRGSPGPSWKQSLLPAQCGHRPPHCGPRRFRRGSTVQPGRRPSGFLAGLFVWASEKCCRRCRVRALPGMRENRAVPQSAGAFLSIQVPASELSQIP